MLTCSVTCSRSKEDQVTQRETRQSNRPYHVSFIIAVEHDHIICYSIDCWPGAAHAALRTSAGFENVLQESRASPKRNSLAGKSQRVQNAWWFTHVCQLPTSACRGVAWHKLSIGVQMITKKKNRAISKRGTSLWCLRLLCVLKYI